jgi:hypothetical protein
VDLPDAGRDVCLDTIQHHEGLCEPLFGFLGIGSGHEAGHVESLVHCPPGHTRLSINDDEIVDRAVVARSGLARP